MSEPMSAVPAHSVPDESSGAVSWSWEIATGTVTWAAGIGEALLGLPPGAFGGTFASYLSRVHPDDRAHFQAVIARTLAGDDESVIVHRVVWPDGSVHWIDAHARLSRDAEGRPLVLSGFAWTATARKLAEARLTHLRRVQAVASAVRKELLRVETDREAFEYACRIAVEHGHFRFAWIGSIATTAKRFAPLARAGFEDGYLDEISSTIDMSSPGPIGRTVREGRVALVNDVATDELFATWREAALRRGYRACGTFPLRRGGEVVAVLCIYAAEANRFDEDQIELLRGLADDIGFKLDVIDADARRRSAEDAVRHSEERYRTLVEQAADAIVLADAEDVVIEVNAAACELTGYTREELVGRHVADLLAPPPGERRVAHRSPPGTRVAGERRVRRKDGALVDVDLNIAVLADGRMQGYARDVTKRNELQQQLIVSDRLASLGRLAAGVAHEINNPLAYVSLSLECIARTIDAARASGSASTSALDAVAEAAADARDGAERARAITRSLAAVSRDDDGAAQAVDIHRVLDAAVRLSENNVRHRGRIVKEYGATREVRGNELRLGQVFVNLLVNASDALREDTPDENMISVRTFDQGDRVIVEVRDNGIGIPPEISGRIFDPFFTTKPIGMGTGLGLSISHGIVSGYGGEIGVESSPGSGTTFRISLVVDGTLTAAGPRPTARAPEPPSGRVRLLIVDDDERVARGLAGVLARHDVTIATSAPDALAVCRREPFDCILCDLVMPGGTGMDVYEELERDGRGLERRMLFMTGGAFTPRARAFVAQLDTEVLEKPFGGSRAESAIAKLLQRVNDRIASERATG